RSRWKRVIPTATLTAVTFAWSSQSASALFPPIWPGTPQTPTVIPPPPVPPPPVVVVPPPPPPIIVPPTVPPPVIVPPTLPPPVIVPPTLPPPHHATPEPSTLAAAIAGLAAAAGWSARRRKAGEKGDETTG